MKINIDDEEVEVEGVDTMWKYEPGKCDSEISRTTDENWVEWIEVKKTLIYGEKSNVAQTVLDTIVYLQV